MAFEPDSIVSEPLKDYEEKLEESFIYKYFASRIPEYENGFKLENKEYKEFYKSLMTRVNEILTLTGAKKRKATGEFFVYLFETLQSNPKQYKVSVNKKRPGSSLDLEKKLESLTGLILGEYKPPLSAHRKKGSMSSLGGLITLAYKALGGQKDDDHRLPSKKEALERVSDFDEGYLAGLTKLIARVAIHRAVKEFFYNSKKGNKPGPRNKTIDRLSKFAKEKNFRELYEYAAIADEDSIIRLQEKVRESKDRNILFPVASDFLGNRIVIAGYGNKLPYFWQNFIKKDKCCFVFINAKKTISNGPLEYRPEKDCVFSSFDEARDKLRHETPYSMTEFLSYDYNKDYREHLKKMRRLSLPDLYSAMADVKTLAEKEKEFLS